MIASFARDFVFLRTRKTASTSVEIVLGSWCGPTDVVTPIGVDDELLRRQFGGAPRNFCTDPVLEERYRVALATEDPARITPIYKREIMHNLRFHHHMSAIEARSLLPGSFWDRAFKFAVERHPYEKVVSLAFWRARNRALNPDAFRDYLDEVVDRGEYRNFDLYSQNGRIIIDKVLRYEQLWEELAIIAERVGTVVPERQPMAKAIFRRDRRPADAILTPDQKARVRRICAEEFALLGYSTERSAFGEPSRQEQTAS